MFSCVLPMPKPIAWNDVLRQFHAHPRLPLSHLRGKKNHSERKGRRSSKNAKRVREKVGVGRRAATNTPIPYRHRSPD